MNPAAETARLRQGLYRLFAGALLPPRQALLVELISAADLLEDMDPSRYAFFPEWQRFVELLRRHATDPDLLQPTYASSPRAPKMGCVPPSNRSTAATAAKSTPGESLPPSRPTTASSG